VSDPCPKFPPLQPPPIRGLLGFGATVGPIRAICGAVAVACGGAGAVALGVIAAKPAVVPHVIGPVVIAAPSSVLLFCLGLLALWAVRK
jgi:hypothetical protein